MKNPYILLLVKATIFVVSFVLLDFLIGFFFDKISNRAFEKNEFARELSHRYCIEVDTSDVVIFGASTANHHYITNQIADSLHTSVYNHGADGCFFLFNNTLMNIMLDRHQPKVIIWEIGESYLSSYYDVNKEYQNMHLLYPWYKSPYVKKMVDKQDCFQKYRMLSNAYKNNSKLLMYFRLCTGDFNQHMGGYLPIATDYTLNDNYYDDTQLLYSNHKIVQEKVIILEQTINRCKELGVKLVMVSSPRYYSDYVKSRDYYIKLREIAFQNDIPFLDFYNAEPFNKEPTWFRERTHMNHIGAEEYMKVFIPALKEVLTQ